jgi:hypothetical protein
VAGGAELRFVGTQAIKNLIDGRLKLGKPGGGYYHFPLGFQADYYKQLRSERREWRKKARPQGPVVGEGQRPQRGLGLRGLPLQPRSCTP